jgi:membrane protein YqaA with SNARE-associated domain
LLSPFTHPYLFTALLCLLTGYIPSISTEIVLAGLGLTITAKQILPLAFIGAVTQSIAKLHLYFLAKKIIPCLKFKSRRKLVKLKHRFTQHQSLSISIIFFSSLTGLPPYYLINLLCGLLNTGWLIFIALGFTGMFIRFSICLACPQLILRFLT